VFSALFVPRIYNASPLAAKVSPRECRTVERPREILVEFRGSRVIEQEMARRLHSD
jgi:hypothetical protein